MQNTVKIRGVRQYSIDHVRRQKKIEKHFVPVILKLLVRQMRDVANFLKASQSVPATRRAMNSIVTAEPWVALIKRIHRRAAYIEANYVGGYIKSTRQKKFRQFGTSLEDIAPVVDQYFDVYLLNQSAIPISDYTKKYVVRHLLNAIDSGRTIEDALKDFNELALRLGSPKSVARAVKIARTESTKSMSLGGLIGAYMTGVDVDKMWVTCEDERVRTSPYSHKNLDKVITGMFNGFNNGESIKFPGDPDASPANTINCRCSMLFVAGADNGKDRNINNFLTDMKFGNV